MGKVAFQHIIGITHSVENAGPEIFHDHIAGPHQRLQRFIPARLAQIDMQAALVAVGGGKIAAHAGAETRRLLAERIALPGLYLDHVGAHITQQHRSQRTRDDPPQVNHPNSAQWHSCPLFCFNLINASDHSKASRKALAWRRIQRDSVMTEQARRQAMELEF